MNEQLPVVVHSPALTPSNISEAMAMADRMATAKLVPQALQKSPGDCFLVIGLAVRWGMDPFAVAQEVSVIRGHLMVSGKLTAAVVNTSGRLAERLNYTFSGEGDGRTVTVTGRLTNEVEPRTVAVRLKDVRTENEVWKKQMDQQLTYSGARIWARRHLPEVMLGVYDRDEDMIDVTPPRQQLPPIATPTAPGTTVPVEAEASGDVAVVHDRETGEIGPRELNADAFPSWQEFGQEFIAMVRASVSLEESNSCRRLNAKGLADMEVEAPKLHAGLMRSISQFELSLMQSAQ
jgi:hypothetical protein